MTDRASWWAKKMGQENAPRTPQQPPTYTPVAQPQQYRPPAQQQQEQPPHQGPMDKAAFEAAMASGDPDRNGGAKTRALQNRPGCPECGAPNYTPVRGNYTDHCYECGFTTRFGQRSA